jgi:transcriptional regulator with XRE-family HTH domain
MDTLKQFGENVKKYRLKSGLSQEQFAFKAGLDRTYVGGVERGERNISLNNIKKISIALEVKISKLFEDI